MDVVLGSKKEIVITEACPRAWLSVLMFRAECDTTQLSRGPLMRQILDIFNFG